MLDASVVIGYLDGDDDQHSRAQTIVAREIDDDLAINVLTLAEVLVLPARENRMQVLHEILRDLEVEEIGLPAGSSARLAQLRATTGLRMPDCCVLLSTIERGARIASFDLRLNKAAVGLGLTVISG